MTQMWFSYYLAPKLTESVSEFFSAKKLYTYIFNAALFKYDNDFTVAMIVQCVIGD